ncbi:GNAT family N-acetyltransferase [Pseudoduganella umbonata]|uniref:GNAT family N-acetyltransferase n=1 Tax=Pseudoduganella umbonata TaxID=864828 RepID=A0A4V1EDJ1_9BURK|nr:GNAT family N-acetyltransferase [Pseudoduganella umbonata]MBB3224369.1 ribosomal protein S18 acetylase RimI-like enzyme [Pseudoduganella umbonata]QCP11261.1 GNAT family N-acetyltransferase [Pseudoduganella umbonata]
MTTIAELTGDGVRAVATQLADVLHDCVAHGASVGFLPPFTAGDALRFWLDVAAQVDAGARTLFVARDSDGIVRGTVQLALATPANGTHRAEVNKMLVHSRCRRLGLGRRLLQAAEARARALGRTLLVLDTWVGSGAQHLYAGLGYRTAGDIPHYAILSGTTLGATRVMYKVLGPAIDVAAVDPASDDAVALMRELSGVLRGITGDDGSASFDAAACTVFAIARDEAGRAVGCGALRPLGGDFGEIAEVKRMYARPGSGAAVGSAVLAFLEARAAALGYRGLWLETRKVNVRAVRFYERQGYLRIPNFGKYAGNDAAVCFGKRL